MREKLIELLGKVTCTGNGESLGSCPDRKYGLCGEVANLSYCVIQNIADHLIANGVTFAKDNDVLSNADRIRAMSDEELVKWGKVQIGCGFNSFPCGIVCDGKCESYSDEDCSAKILKWLQQTAEEG